MRTKVTRVFSWPLMKQSLRSNLVLAVVVTLIMCMMSVVITYAGNLMGSVSDSEDYSEAQADFYSYLYVLASYNEMSGMSLSYDDFAKGDNEETYEQVFSMLSAQSDDLDLTTTGFAAAADALSESELGLDTYITQFEYIYALGSVQGCFSGDDLDISTMMSNMLEMMGISSTLIEDMSEMDSTAMINQMYYTVMCMLAILLFIIVAGNNLVVNQVDKGSMAFILATPTKRSAVAITQFVYMLVMPLLMLAVVFGVRTAAIHAFVGEVNVQQLLALYGGMYLLVEAMASICYMTSCIFNLSKYSMAIGGGLNIWFFLASLLGMFGSDSMVQMGIGSSVLNRFNHLTIIGLFDYTALGTVGSGAVDYGFVWKLCVLVAIAVVCYIVGAVWFRKKDLPL